MIRTEDKSSNTNTRRVFFLCTPTTKLEEQGFWLGGRTDEPLSDKGMETSRAIARFLKAHIKKEKLKLDYMYCSPLLRSVQTADFIHDDVRVKIRVLHELRDRDLGEWEGKPRPVEEKLDLQGQETIPRGESLTVFESRIDSLLNAVASSGGTSLIVSHERVLHVLASAFQIENLNIASGEIHEIQWTGGTSQRPTIVRVFP